MGDMTKMAAFRCIIIIVDYKIRERLVEFLADSQIPIHYQMHGVGTASSEFLNLCGLGDTHKSITVCFVRKSRTRMLLAEMNQALQLHKKGTGIAISVPVGGMQGWLYKLLEADKTDPAIEDPEREITKMSETITHSMILISINQGYSDDVMGTARAAGATGGTILKGLKCSPTEAAQRFGLSLQEEQEILVIVAPRDKKAQIMSAISKEHGAASPAHGITISLPVDAIMGL